MKHKPSLSRRGFMKKSAAAAIGAPAIIPASALGRGGAVAPSNRITLGFIGTGSHGVGVNLKTFLRLPDAQAVALCDVDASRMTGALNAVLQTYGRNFKGCDTTGDWREIIERKDIDAVMISTPDHWHVPISLAAIRAGKDVCCEKPTLSIQEGRVLADSVQRYGAVFQTSTEDRSVAVYHRMAELVRNGRIGKLHTIRVKLWSGHSKRAAGPRAFEPQAVPKGFDYDMWLGPAPEAPYCPARCHFNFRWIYDYSGGMLTDWGAHLLDTAQWGNDTERTGPVEIDGKGVFPTDGLYDTATEYNIDYKYANGVRMNVQSGGCGIRFEGTGGWVGNEGWRGGLQASSVEIANSVIGPNEVRLFLGPGEQRNFIDCVKTRSEPYFPAEIGHRCSSVMHLGNISMLLGRKLRWDPGNEEFINDEQANRMRSRAMREPWTL